MTDATTKLARAAKQLGEEARAWELTAALLDEVAWFDEEAGAGARARAANLGRFVREELAAPTEPVVLVPAALLTRALEAIPSQPCCAEVPRCWCSVGALKHELRLAADGAPAGAEAEPAGEHARRIAR